MSIEEFEVLSVYFRKHIYICVLKNKGNHIFLCARYMYNQEVFLVQRSHVVIVVIMVVLRMYRQCNIYKQTLGEMSWRLGYAFSLSQNHPHVYRVKK